MIEATDFQEFVRRFETPVFGFFFRLIQNEELAEHLAFEAFLSLRRSGCRDGQDCLTAIYRMAIELVKQHSSFAHRVDVSRSFIAGDKKAAIALAVGDLPIAQRLAVLLHKYQGLNIVQIGKVLDLDKTQVEALLLSGYQVLRAKLAGVG